MTDLDIPARADRMTNQTARIENVRSRPGLEERIAEIVAETVKASLPVPTVTPATWLDRPQGWAGQFGPGIPILPSQIDPREPGGARPEPRVTQYQVSTNIQLGGDRFGSYPVLRQVADAVDVMRRCIELRKSHMASLEWGIGISKRTLKRIVAEDSDTSPGRAAQIARQRFSSDIARVEDFWETPDKGAGIDFAGWLGALMEDMLVLDAVAVYPHLNLGADDGLYSYELIDGATIKPIVDNRGARPQPPLPAYQQVLFGVPRSEFIASQPVAHPSMLDRLVYWRQNVRTHTPYGFSPVEHALSVADLYMKRTGWIRAEFTEGTVPTAVFDTTGSNWTPDQLSQFEQIFNDDLAGQTTARHRARFLPPGLSLVTVTEWADKFTADLDDHLIKLVCACFDVMPTEIGFAPKGGIGGKGHQEGEESSTYRKDYRPTVVRLQGLLTHLCRVYLNMPHELEFQFFGYEIEDQKQVAEQLDIEVKNGTRTLNDGRAMRGDPLYDFPEADTPFVVTGAGIQFLPGSIAAAKDAAELAAGVADAPSTLPVPDDQVVPPEAAAVDSTELEKFTRFVTKRRKAGSWRPFTFDKLNPYLAKTFNELGEAGDYEGIGELLGKAQAPGRGLTPLIDRFTPRLAAALRSIFPDDIAQMWGEHLAATKSVEELDDAKAFMAGQDIDPEDLEGELDDLHTEAFHSGIRRAAGTIGWDPDEVEDDIDDEDTEIGSKRSKLKQAAVTVAKAMIVSKSLEIATALISNRDGNQVDAVDAVMGNDEWAQSWATAEAHTADVTAAAATYQTANVERVRLISSEGDCEFCSGYDGRILNLPDDESGLPPLHPFCSCDIEPL